MVEPSETILRARKEEERSRQPGNRALLIAAGVCVSYTKGGKAANFNPDARQRAKRASLRPRQFLQTRQLISYTSEA